jgi:hypothetical protein
LEEFIVVNLRRELANTLHVEALAVPLVLLRLDPGIGASTFVLDIAMNIPRVSSNDIHYAQHGQVKSGDPPCAAQVITARLIYMN